MTVTVELDHRRYEITPRLLPIVELLTRINPKRPWQNRLTWDDIRAAYPGLKASTVRGYVDQLGRELKRQNRRICLHRDKYGVDYCYLLVDSNRLKYFFL